jgi:hypothetical protein
MGSRDRSLLISLRILGLHPEHTVRARDSPKDLSTNTSEHGTHTGLWQMEQLFADAPALQTLHSLVDDIVAPVVGQKGAAVARRGGGAVFVFSSAQIGE